MSTIGKARPRVVLNFPANFRDPGLRLLRFHWVAVYDEAGEFIRGHRCFGRRWAERKYAQVVAQAAEDGEGERR